MKPYCFIDSNCNRDDIQTDNESIKIITVAQDPIHDHTRSNSDHTIIKQQGSVTNYSDDCIIININKDSININQDNSLSIISETSNTETENGGKTQVPHAFLSPAFLLILNIHVISWNNYPTSESQMSSSIYVYK